MCQDIIDRRPFGDIPFYIFAHSRTIGLDEKCDLYNKDLNNFLSISSYTRLYQTMDQVPEKRLIWQPRLTKPKSQSNSMLFKAYPGTDVIKVIWMIPAEELWKQYIKGNLTENSLIIESIHDFKNNRQKLDKEEEDDLSDDIIYSIYADISRGCTPKQPFKLITS